MKKTTAVVSLILYLCVSFTSIDAVSANGSIKWAVDVDDEIVYLLERKTISSSFAEYVDEFAPFIAEIEVGQRIITRVEYLMPLSEVVNASPSDPLSYSTIIRENDSAILAENVSFVVIPVGIWDLNNTSNNTLPEGLSIIDTAEQWGTVFEGQYWFLLFPFSFMFEMVYFKENGTLSSISAVVKMAGTPQIDIKLVQWHEGMTTPDNSPPFDMVAVTLLTVILIALFISVVVILVYYRRHAHTLTQQ